MQNENKGIVMQLYATLLRAHIALLDEILDSATSDACRRTATKASEQICSTVYHLIHDTGFMPNYDMMPYIEDLAPTADDFDFSLMDDVRAMELQVWPHPIGGHIGFGLYPAN
jgi:hypothetical protein